MSKPWNFPCWQHRDRGEEWDRCSGGMIVECGPGAQNPNPQPFVNDITLIFSFLFRSGWSDFVHPQGLFSIGIPGLFTENQPLSLGILDVGGGYMVLRTISRDTDANVERYNIELGDEDGTNWIQEDKWYQVGISFNDTEFTYCINGSITPKVNKVIDAPGVPNFDAGSERLFIGHGSANGDVSPLLITSGWPTCVVGTAALHNETLDFNNLIVRNRIWDAVGNFKNPGENGSLWFDDIYGDTEPSIFLPDGSCRFATGSFPVTWTARKGPGVAVTCPGGFKKQYHFTRNYEVQDKFIDSNGTLLTAHTPNIDVVGSGWVKAENGTFDIQTNKANCSIIGSSPHAIFTIDSGKADVIVEAIVNSPNFSVGLVLRHTSGNFWLLHGDPVGTVKIYEYNGSFVERASASFTFSDDKDYNFKFIASGTVLTGFINSVERLSYASATMNQTETTHGFRSNVLNTLINNFTITEN